jgi:general secretion pathway protein G
MKINPYRRSRPSRRAHTGFTLVEMLLVLVILSALATIVYPNITKHGPEARLKATRVQIAALGTALDMFGVDDGFYPQGQNGLQDLVQAPNNAPHWHGPYIDKIPKDQWGHDYIYTCPGIHRPNSYDLMSMGPDGQPGTEDDITNWD